MQELKKLFWSALPTLSIALIVVGVHVIAFAFDSNLHRLGIEPRKMFGLIGILAGPFVHSGWDHLFSNLGPFIGLGAALWYFHPKVAGQSLLWIYLLCGAWVWIIGRPSYHIGASGIVYGLAAFLFFSGVVSRKISELAVSFIVVLLYGSMVWGVLPLYPGISWESHLCGAMAGAVMAWYYGPKNRWKSKFYWDDEEEFELNHISHHEQYPEEEIEEVRNVTYNYVIGTKDKK